ncbi:MAG: ribosomal RNA small subunit methyltransferase A [Candidatus Omnitrophica bacterium]|nr:ribosomal RNA small subunit methyltransferase A [Candidatus Omnitrophota bacterium]
MHQIQLLRKYGLSVRGFRGQHLLVDENVQRKIVSAIDPKSKETIVEIGPGLGAITALLLESGARVIAVEQDSRFVEILQGELGRDFRKLSLVHGDILKTDLQKFVKGKIKLRVIGNIPYYITSPILLYLIGQRSRIDSVYLTIQREIADRIFAQPGSKAYGRLSLLVRFYADANRLFEISRNCFSPVPNVDSTFIELVFRRALPSSIDESVLFKIIQYGFKSRRKNILNAISEGFKDQMPREEIRALIHSAGLRDTMRAEELMLKDFIRLAEHMGKRCLGSSVDFAD